MDNTCRFGGYLALLLLFFFNIPYIPLACRTVWWEFATGRRKYCLADGQLRVTVSIFMP